MSCSKTEDFGSLNRYSFGACQTCFAQRTTSRTRYSSRVTVDVSSAANKEEIVCAKGRFYRSSSPPYLAHPLPLISCSVEGSQQSPYQLPTPSSALRPCYPTFLSPSRSAFDGRSSSASLETPGARKPLLSVADPVMRRSSFSNEHFPTTRVALYLATPARLPLSRIARALICVARLRRLFLLFFAPLLCCFFVPHAMTNTPELAKPVNSRPDLSDSTRKCRARNVLLSSIFGMSQ